MKKDYDITLRGHHLFALYVFYFLGGAARIWELAYFRYSYSKKTTEHLIKILRKITKSDIRVKIVDTLDDICEECDSEDSSCSSRKKAMRDTKRAVAAGLEIGETYSSRYILKRLETLSKDKRSIFYRKTVEARL